MPVPIYRPALDCRHCELRSMRLFCDLTSQALVDFQSIGMQMRLPRGAVLFQEGDPGSSIAVLCEGQVKLRSTSREGKTLILKIAMPGDVLGLGAVISGSCYEVTAEALEPATVKRIRKDEFLSFLSRHSQASMHAARVLSEEYKSAFFDARRLALAPSAAGRLASVLLDLGRNASGEDGQQRFTMALTHEELANLAGISRETVTRMLSRFKRERWIRIHGSSVTILARERLLELAS
jgi:CRP/FNR family transcriptional regulator, cyclic AMP receptor protein